MKNLFVSLKTPFIAFFLMLSTTSFSQIFNGITIGGSLTEFTNKMKEKGYTFVKSNDGGGVVMKGTLSGDVAEFWISVTPKSKIVWKMSIYFPELQSWSSIKSDYINYKSTLTNKYGEPDKSFEFFTTPYYEGDGYEMQALKLEKVTFSSYWIRKSENFAIAISITKFSQLRISYENVSNAEILNKEKSEIDNAIF